MPNRWYVGIIGVPGECQFRHLHLHHVGETRRIQMVYSRKGIEQFHWNYNAISESFCLLGGILLRLCGAKSFIWSQSKGCMANRTRDQNDRISLSVWILCEISWKSRPQNAGPLTIQVVQSVQQWKNVFFLQLKLSCFSRFLTRRWATGSYY